MSEDQLLFVLLFMCAIGFGALNRNLSRNRRNKGNTTVTPNPGKNEKSFFERMKEYFE